MVSIACGPNSMVMRAAAWVAIEVAFLVAASQADAENRAFLHISDIHLDPFTPYAGRTLSHYGEDTNHALLNASLQAIAHYGATSDFAIVTGDLLVHDFDKRL